MMDECGIGMDGVLRVNVGRKKSRWRSKDKGSGWMMQGRRRGVRLDVILCVI